MAETDLWFGTLSATVRVEDLPASRQVVAIELPANGEWRVCGAGTSNADGIAMLPITGMPTSRIYAVAIDDWGRPFVPGMTVAFGDVIRPTQFLGWMYQVTAPGEMPSTEPDWWNSMAGVPQPVGTAMMQAVRHYQPIAHGPVGDIEWVELEFDPHWGNVAALLHFDEDFTDETGRAWSRYGAAEINNEVFRFGGGSLSSPKTPPSGLISNSPIYLSNLDFTIEAYTKRSNDEAVGMISMWGDSSTYRRSFELRSVNINNNNQIQFGYSLNGRDPFYLYGDIPSSIGDEFFHVAIVRHAGTISIYIEGIALASTHIGSQSIHSPSGSVVRIGAEEQQDYGAADLFLDDLRITVGVARYIENFDPPTAPFPNVGPPL